VALTNNRFIKSPPLKKVYICLNPIQTLCQYFPLDFIGLFPITPSLLRKLCVSIPVNPIISVMQFLLTYENLCVVSKRLIPEAKAPYLALIAP
jgi:hypothetical protein